MISLSVCECVWLLYVFIDIMYSLRNVRIASTWSHQSLMTSVCLSNAGPNTLIFAIKLANHPALIVQLYYHLDGWHRFKMAAFITCNTIKSSAFVRRET